MMLAIAVGHGMSLGVGGLLVFLVVGFDLLDRRRR